MVDKKIRVLVLDDGGVQVLSQLRILQHILANVESNHGDATKPCEYFDLIVGSGLGGLLALLLGKFQQSIPECETILKELGPSLVFKSRGTAIRDLWWSPRGATTQAGKAVKQLFDKIGIPLDTKLYEQSAEEHGKRSCRTCVLAIKIDDLRSTARLRDYASRCDPLPLDCFAKDVAFLCTDPKEYYHNEVGGFTLLNGGYKTPNPVREAFVETVRIWKPSSIAVMLSLGSGTRNSGSMEISNSYPKRVYNVVTALLAQSTDRESVHLQFKDEAEIFGIQYFRFDVPNLGEIQDGAWEHSSTVLSKTGSYIESCTKDLRLCAQIFDDISVESVSSQPGNNNASRFDDSNPEVRDTMIQATNTPAHSISSSQESSNLRSGNFDSLTLCSSDEHKDAAKAADKWMCRLKENFLPLIPIGSRRNPRDPRVRVAILDTGINKEGLTTDQQERIIAMRDWTSEGSDMVDTTGHGTFIASLILNMAEACHLYVGKVFNSSDSNDETPEHVAEAIHHCVKSEEEQGWNVDIIVMAFGFDSPDEGITDSLRKAFVKKKILLAAAANHGGLQQPAFPARYPGVISINSASGLGYPSTFNPIAEISDDNFTFLGESVHPLGTNAPKGVLASRKTGTSMATAIAGAIAALLLELCSDKQFEIENHEALKSYEGMRKLFAVMANDINQKETPYRWVRPWNSNIIRSWNTRDRNNPRRTVAQQLSFTTISISRYLDDL